MAIDPINFARTTQVRLRRGTTGQIAANPPVEAEPFYDLTSQRMGVGGGSDGIVEQWKSQFLEHTADAADAVPRILQEKLTTEMLSVKDFGAVGDGVTDDTEAFIKMAAKISDNSTATIPPGIYKISHSGFSSFSSVYGNSAFHITGKKNIQIIGRGAVIVIDNHDISTYGGLLAFRFTDCQNIMIDGIEFDMTFSGFKDSASFYPNCGAIVANSSSESDGSSLSNLIFQNLKFKLFHPLGQYVTTSNPYLGDNNNGFKIFSIFVSGAYNATAFEYQSKNVIIQNCIVKKGHNAYGLWVWAFNNAAFLNNVAEDWVSKRSNTSSAIAGGGVPFIRHHQFYTAGCTIRGNFFRSRKSSERGTSGFEGNSDFCHLTTNLLGSTHDRANGEYVISDNVAIIGNGDSANSLLDNFLLGYPFGHICISSNTIDGHDGDSLNAYGAVGISLSYTAGGGNGVASVVIDGNNFGQWCKNMNNIIVSNNGDNEYKRRCKQLVVSNNTSLAQRQYFFLGSDFATTNRGFRQLSITGNLISGRNSYFDKNSTNSRAIGVSAAVAGDMLNIANNTIEYKYYGIYADAPDAGAHRNYSGNIFSNVAVESLNMPVNNVVDSGTFTPVLTFDTPGDLSISYSNQSGIYERNGDTVTISVAIATSSFTWSTSSGVLRITGLPFTPAAGRTFCNSLSFQGITKTADTFFVRTDGNSIIIGTSTSGGSYSGIIAANTTSSTNISIAFSMTYTI